MASLSENSFPSFLFLLFSCCFVIGEATESTKVGKVRLQVLLTRFSNPGNRNALNQCCDGTRNASICTDSCDIFFTVCPDTGACIKSKVFLRNGSEFIATQRNVTAASGNTDGNFVSMVFPFYLKFQRHFFCSFSIRLYDDDSQDLSLNGTQSWNETLVNYTETIRKPVKYLSFHRNISRNNISFEFVYILRFSCEKNFYGDICNKYCEPKDDTYGHKKCLSNGTSVCLPGWKGPTCTDPICPGGCKNKGLCKKPNFCSCDNNQWTGPTCEECVPDKRCLHAICDGPGQGCSHCKTNWTGNLCNVYKDYCSHYRPCKNGRCNYDPNKNYTCSCYTGWDGPKCDKFLCSSSCNITNAVCKNDGKCSCNAGWTGADCNQCIPTANCTHGYCNRPFECLCEEGWGGENCTAPVSKSRCSQRNPCQNDGVCSDLDMGNYNCVCKRGFTGRHCENKVLDPCSTWCNESNGYCQDTECRCFPGWQGPSCTECVKNSSCINGFCRRPFECICLGNWTGPSCNISRNNECGSDSDNLSCGGRQRIGSSESIAGNDQLIYILSSVLVLLVLLSVLFLAWKLRRRRATFDVSSSTVIGNAFGIPSYTIGNITAERQEFNLDNNNSVSHKPTSPEIHLNPMTLQPSQNSKSMLLDSDREIYEVSDVINNEDNSPDSSEYRVI